MKILIEDAENLKYLANDSQWTKNVAEGKSFPSTGTAFAAAKKETVGKFNIVSYISATRQFINLNHGRGKNATEAAAV